jgi:hypothetical protein
MLTRLADDPTGEGGFRVGEISGAAVRHGWVCAVWETRKIRFYKITETGRAAIVAWRAKQPKEPRT